MASRLDRFLVLSLAIVLVGTVAIILANTRASTAQATLAQMEQVMTRVAFEASDEAGAFLDPAESFARLTADLIEDGVFHEDEEDGRFEEFLLDVLRQNPLQSGYFVGRPDGDFFYVNRDDSQAVDGTRTKVIEVQGPAREVRLTWHDEDGQVVRTELDPSDDFDPTSRPWYEAAVEAGGFIWTDPYIFFSSRQPGITAAAPIRNAANRIVGVFGVDVEIRQLSRILATLPISDRGEAFIVDHAGQLVAISTAAELGIEDGNTIRRLTPAELDDAAVRAAYRVLESAGGAALASPDFLPFETDGEPWRASVEPFARGRWPWNIVVFAPEDDFLQGVKATDAANTRLATIVGGIALVVALGLTAGLTRPLARMRRSVETDPLTTLGNRRALERRGSALFAKGRDEGMPLAAVALDIDHFKRVNDSYGHAIGDEVLRAVSARFRRALRDEDVLIRQGGEEFVALLPDTDAEEAMAVSERLLAGTRGAPINTSSGPIPITVSAGLALLDVAVDGSTHDLLARADAALYRAKEEGRDRVVAVDAPA